MPTKFEGTWMFDFRDEFGFFVDGFFDRILKIQTTSATYLAAWHHLLADLSKRLKKLIIHHEF